MALTHEQTTSIHPAVSSEGGAQPLSAREAAISLYQDVFLGNGIPTYEQYAEAQLFADGIERSADPETGEATYTIRNVFDETASPQRIDAHTAESLSRIADPATWLHSDGVRDVLRHAVTMETEERLATAADEGETNALELADKVVDPLVNGWRDPKDRRPITAGDYEAVLALERGIREQLTEQHVSPSQIRKWEARNSRYLRAAAPAPKIQAAAKPPYGYALHPGQEGSKGKHGRAFAVGRVSMKKADDKEYLEAITNEPDEDKVLAWLIATNVARPRQERHGVPLDSEDTILLQREYSLHTAEDIAKALYPHRTGGSTQYALHRSGQRSIEHALTDSERERVKSLARKFDIITRNEAAVKGEFNAGTDVMPTDYQLAFELFPQSHGVIEDLTDSQRMVVEAAMTRLQEYRKNLTPGPRVWLRERWKTIRAKAVAAKDWAAEVQVGAQETVQAAGTRIGQALGATALAWSSVTDTSSQVLRTATAAATPHAVAAKEYTRGVFEKLKNKSARVSRLLGDTILAKTMIVPDSVPTASERPARAESSSMTLRDAETFLRADGGYWRERMVLAEASSDTDPNAAWLLSRDPDYKRYLHALQLVDVSGRRSRRRAGLASHR